MNLWFDDPRSKALELSVPPYYDVLIEIENVPEKGYEEMTKLTYFNSHLKILVLHLWPDDFYEKAQTTLAKNFASIIAQANRRYCENTKNEYLLITIQKIGQELHSTSTIFAVKDLVDGALKFTMGQVTVFQLPI